ncbi:COX assembly mitochondrial protein 2 homolog [Phalaenopsis equestris]|uniref:COX assembly mitochondrial protein 2 homolog n=1 Tax=Phalaenopsis equestris TaxID=78828 RepID=UPI0009E27F03|nr:COX assembly mitochondrial protein 2 homolog [Phalaenopsis equestris]
MHMIELRGKWKPRCCRAIWFAMLLRVSCSPTLIIELFQKCHEDHPIGKFFGECTELKLKLDRCFREEKALRRKANFEESKKFKERLKAYRKEMADNCS